jgi:hypothetical protein
MKNNVPYNDMGISFSAINTWASDPESLLEKSPNPNSQ